MSPRPSVRRALALVGALGLCVSLVAGCGDDDSAADSAGDSTATRAFDADNGTVEIPTDPQSVVACGYAVLPLVQGGANLSAVCEWTRELDNMDAETRAAYDAIPKVGRDADVASINYEAIAAADPDLIIMGVPSVVIGELRMDALEALAPVVILGPIDPGDWRTLGERYADAAGVGDVYGETKAEYEALAAEIADRYADVAGDLTFGGVCTVCGAEANEYMREYASSYTTNLFDDLGFSFPGDPADPDGGHGAYLALENITADLGAVDVIVYSVDEDGSLDPDFAALTETALWQNLPAVQAGNLVEVRHSRAATYQTAILALRAIDAELSELPAFAG